MDTKQAMEYGKASIILERALSLVREAFTLVDKSGIKDLIEFEAIVGWTANAWKVLDNEYEAANPDSKDKYAFKAFRHFKLPDGEAFSLHGTTNSIG